MKNWWFKDQIHYLKTFTLFFTFILLQIFVLDQQFISTAIQALDLMCKFLIFSTDRSGLKHPEQVSLFQNKLVESLKWVMANDICRTPQTVSTAMTAISELRSLLIQYGDWILGMKVSGECSESSIASGHHERAALRTRHRSADRSEQNAMKHRRMSEEFNHTSAMGGIYQSSNIQSSPINVQQKNTSTDGKVGIS